MKFRKTTKNDLQAIVQMIADDELGKKRENYKVPLPSEYIKAFENIISDSNQELIVVENVDAEIIGTFQLTFIQYLTYQGGIRAQLEGVRIRKDLRVLGIGNHMIHWVIKRVKERNAHVLQLTTDKQRPKAIKFYEDYGFVASHQGMKLRLD